jgi:excisionase family DNA binding protein
MTMPEDTLLNVTQVRVILGGKGAMVFRPWVYQLVQAGKLKAIRLGEVRGLRIYKSSLDKFMRDRERGMTA